MVTKTHTKYISKLGIGFALLISATLPAFSAKPASALTVSPIRLELNGDPGDTVFGNFKLFNEQSQSVKYYIAFRTFRSKDETGEPEFPVEQDELISWIDSEEQVTVPAKDFKELTFKVKIPAGADPGSHFAGIFATPSLPEKTNDGDLKIVGEVGTLILFRVNGDIKEGANILEFKTKDGRDSFTELPVWFTYRYQNGGDTYVKPLGDIVIKNMFGSTAKILPANKDKGNVLPGSTRKFDIAWLEASGTLNQSPDARNYGEPTTFWDHVSHQWSNFALGKYTASLNIAYGNSSDKGATAQVSFWMVPWHLLSVVGAFLVLFLGGMVIIAIIVALFLLKVGNRGKKKRTKSKKTTKKKPVVEEEEEYDEEE